MKQERDQYYGIYRNRRKVMQEAKQQIKDPKICIDFYPGSHGNYLEFACNKIAGVETKLATPFSRDGAAHFKQYIGPRSQVFHAAHWFFEGGPLPTTKILSIGYTVDDVLPLAQVSFLRSGPGKFDSDLLQNNTFHTLNNRFYKGTLDIIRLDYFVSVILPKYNNIREQLDLPEIFVLEQYNELSEDTKTLLKDKYDIVPLKLDEEQPDCPRHILRNYFERKMTLQLMNRQALMVYDETKDVHKFPYDCFYNEDQFIEELKKVATWAGFQYNDYDSIRKLHSQFIRKQPYAYSKQKADQVIEDVINKTGAEPDILTLLEESYVNSKLVELGHERRYRY
jgi:hypothetical protein